MHNTIFRGRFAPLALACLALAGCSGEPSDSNMADALKNDPMLRMVASEMSSRPVSPGRETTAEAFLDSLTVAKLGCVEAQGAPGYVCDFKFTIGTNKSNKMSDRPGKGRFFKGPDGWSFEEIR